jgi:acetyl-CoA acetyltransferase
MKPSLAGLLPQIIQVTRERRDQFALGSQHKASAAHKAERFKDEIAPVTMQTRKGDVVVNDDAKQGLATLCVGGGVCME